MSKFPHFFIVNSKISLNLKEVLPLNIEKGLHACSQQTLEVKPYIRTYPSVKEGDLTLKIEILGLTTMQRC